MKLPREEYPRCPRCGGPCAAATMTSGSVEVSWPDEPDRPPRRAYFVEALSVYCVSADCNFDAPLERIPYPPPPPGFQSDRVAAPGPPDSNPR